MFTDQRKGAKEERMECKRKGQQIESGRAEEQEIRFKKKMGGKGEQNMKGEHKIF